MPSQKSGNHQGRIHHGPEANAQFVVTDGHKRLKITRILHPTIYIPWHTITELLFEDEWEYEQIQRNKRMARK